MTVQNYENSWKLTVEYPDIHGKRFLGTLKIIVDFIDANSEKDFSSELFEELQQQVCAVYPKVDFGSIRKSINQFVKLGFVNCYLKSYHIDTKDFLNSKTNRKRNTLFSKIVYSNAKFNASVTVEHNWSQINFLLKTLAEVGKLSKSEIIALMLVDIGNIRKGFLTAKELAVYVAEAEKINFIERKYNQVGYLTNFLRKLDDVVFVRDELYFEEDAKRIFGDELKEERKVRDPYLHRLYKNQLQEESIYHFEDTKCMVEQLAYPVLIASHIKPFIKSDENEAYDVNNGILLSKNMDSLFDLGYISFEDNGNIIFAEQLNSDVKQFVSNYKLDARFLNEKRIEYLKFHRTEVFELR